MLRFKLILSPFHHTKINAGFLNYVLSDSLPFEGNVPGLLVVFGQ
jgi:hypothetical protein